MGRERNGRKDCESSHHTAEKVAVLLIKGLDDLDEILCHKPVFVDPALDLGKAEDAVDAVGQTVRVLDHVPDVFELVLPRKLVPAEGLQIELDGGDRGLQFMGEIADEVALETVELNGLLIVDEDGEYAHQNDAHQNGKDKDHQPGLGRQNLILVQAGPLDDTL